MSAGVISVPSVYAASNPTITGDGNMSDKDKRAQQVKQVTKNSISGIYTKHVVEEVKYAKKPMLIVGAVTLVLTVAQGLFMTNVFSNSGESTLWYEFSLWAISVVLDVAALLMVFCNAKNQNRTVKLFHQSQLFLSAGLLVALVRTSPNLIFVIGCALAIGAMYLVFSMGSLKMMFDQKKKNQVHVGDDMTTYDMLLMKIQEDDDQRQLILEVAKKDERAMAFLLKLEKYQVFFDKINTIVKSFKHVDQSNLEPLLVLLQQVKDIYKLKDLLQEEADMLRNMKKRLEQVYDILPSRSTGSGRSTAGKQESVQYNDDLQALFHLIETSDKNVSNRTEYSSLKRRLQEHRQGHMSWIDRAEQQYTLQQDIQKDIQRTKEIVHNLDETKQKLQDTFVYQQEQNILQVAEHVCLTVKEQLALLGPVDTSDLHQQREQIATLKDEVVDPEDIQQVLSVDNNNNNNRDPDEQV